jgi:hypothetical protein
MPKSRALAAHTIRQLWSEGTAEAVLAALDASGLSAAAIASREGLDLQRLYFWRRRRAGARRAPAAPAFVEVRSRSIGHVEIVLRSGRIFRAAESIDPGALRRLAEALDPDAAC